MELTHLDKDGAAHMVDVSAKPIVSREAVATGRIALATETLALIASGQTAKGDVMATARIAGIQAAKRTADLIPLCHQLPLSSVKIDLVAGGVGIDAIATVRTTARTGVEMEALTAVSVCLLTVYDMLKAVDKGMIISDIRLVSKVKEGVIS